jgi:hypothetical protein
MRYQVRTRANILYLSRELTVYNRRHPRHGHFGPIVYGGSQKQRQKFGGSTIRPRCPWLGCLLILCSALSLLHIDDLNGYVALVLPITVNTFQLRMFCRGKFQFLLNVFSKTNRHSKQLQSLNRVPNWGRFFSKTQVPKMSRQRTKI